MKALTLASLLLLSSTIATQNFVPMAASMTATTATNIQLVMNGGPTSIGPVMLAPPHGESGTVNLPASAIASTQTASRMMHVADIQVPNSMALCGLVIDAWAVKAAPLTIATPRQSWPAPPRRTDLG